MRAGKSYLFLFLLILFIGCGKSNSPAPATGAAKGTAATPPNPSTPGDDKHDQSIVGTQRPSTHNEIATRIPLPYRLVSIEGDDSRCSSPGKDWTQWIHRGGTYAIQICGDPELRQLKFKGISGGNRLVFSDKWKRSHAYDPSQLADVRDWPHEFAAKIQKWP